MIIHYYYNYYFNNYTKMSFYYPDWGNAYNRYHQDMYDRMLQIYYKTIDKNKILKEENDKKDDEIIKLKNYIKILENDLIELKNESYKFKSKVFEIINSKKLI